MTPEFATANRRFGACAMQSSMPIADNITIEFAWDPAKAKSNLAKHGVSFNQAASLILDPLAITVADLKHSENEDRWFT